MIGKNIKNRDDKVKNNNKFMFFLGEPQLQEVVYNIPCLGGDNKAFEL